jgi:two-component system, LytTR family, response regulator
MIKAIIVEDEMRGIEVLSALILVHHAEEIEILAIAKTCEEAVQKINTLHPNIVFLDIELPDGNGFNILDQIIHKDISIVFTTAYDSYAIRAIRYSALDFLSKPIDETEFAQAIARYKSKNLVEYPLQIKNLIDNSKNTHQKIALPTMDGLIFIATSDIVKISAEGAYSLIYLSSKTSHLVSKNIGIYEDILPEEQFCRIHHSTIINLSHVTKYFKGRGGHVILSDGSSESISVRKQSVFLERYL